MNATQVQRILDSALFNERIPETAVTLLTDAELESLDDSVDNWNGDIFDTPDTMLIAMLNNNN